LQHGRWAEVNWEFFSQFGMLGGLEFDFKNVQESLRSHTEDGRLTFDWWCPLSQVDGYGRHALSIFSGLRALGVEPCLQDVGWKDRKYLSRALEAETEENGRRPPCRIGVCMSVPYDLKICHHSSIYKIAITQFETDHIPPYHIAQVNQCDQLITTSKFQPDVWRRSGLKASLPISVMTAGIDTEFFGFKERPRGGTFKVLMLGALTGRKDPVTAVKVFQKASGGAEDWRLTLKTRQTDVNPALMQLLGFKLHQEETPEGNLVYHIPFPFREKAPADPRIEFVVSDDSQDRLLEWFWSHDCFLWTSKGEGVGLPPLEAMATGMEVVMSNNSGMADYAHASHCWPVATHHMEPATGSGGFSRTYVEAYGDVGRWWVPDPEVAMYQLASAYRAWKRGKGKGVKAAEYVRSHHTLHHQARSVLDVIERYA
jgi:glycosyltransferase involved in cell wall biosynthesis